MADEFKHTDAGEMEDFLSKNQTAQLLEIWLNGRETNGHVADAFSRIAAQGLEIQRIWVNMSEHAAAPHPDAQKFAQLEKQHNDLWSVWRFSRWFIPISIPASIMVVTTIFEIVRIARGG